MADREKVINALEDYEPYAREFDSLSVYGWVVLDALALLKEQEEKRMDGLSCPSCDFFLGWAIDELGGQGNVNFCPHCGQAVKWA